MSLKASDHTSADRSARGAGQTSEQAGGRAHTEGRGHDGDENASPEQAAHIVEVAVPRPLRQTFNYLVPAGMKPPPLGARVRVPFGNGSVVGIACGPGVHREQLKPITEVLDDEPIMSQDLIHLAHWASAYYHHPIGDVYATMLPVLARRGERAEATPQYIWRATEAAAKANLGRAHKQREALEALCAAQPVADESLAALGIARPIARALAEKGLALRIVAEPTYALSPSPFTATREQDQAVREITGALHSGQTFLLEGVTGSGKTEVYLRVIERVLEEGGQALVLVPEIALTPQAAMRFRDRFGAAATLHSSATNRERLDTWLKCRDGTHKVLIGTRSAVLTPFQGLGVIVVDEEHDGSFKQGDGWRYSARDLAVKRGRDLSIPVVLGSATPSLESIENTRRGRYRHLVLTARAGGASMPTYRILDLRGQRLHNGFSEPMLDAIDQHLSRQGQVLVYINRRGYSPVLVCRRCGWQALCDRCDARMVLHLKPRALLCHQCDARAPIPTSCPGCGHEEVAVLGTGTQRIEETLAERHPDIPLYRIDRDTTRNAKRLADRLDAVRTGHPAILVGTQMLAKGHDLPGVTLVAVIDADHGFLSADFRAGERTAQLIVQVAGRAGRGDRPGEVWIQTLDPEGATLQALVRSGYRGFAESEAERRREADMPPFAALAMVRAESKSAQHAEEFLARLAATVDVSGVSVLGPAPAPLARRADWFRFQLMLLSVRRAPLHEALNVIEDMPAPTHAVRWSIDVDPLDTL